MIKIFEKHQQLRDIKNYQTRIIQCESFEDYLNNIELPKICEVSHKSINYELQSVTFIVEIVINGVWVEFIHFAQVIE
jgi:hypothetical protein